MTTRLPALWLVIACGDASTADPAPTYAADPTAESSVPSHALPRLDQLSLSIGELSPRFSPDHFAYEAQAGFLQGATTVTARWTGDLTVSIDGETLQDDTPGAPVLLAEDVTNATVRVSNSEGTSQEYFVSVRRADTLEIAQSDRLRPNELGLYAQFGSALAADAGRVAVGAWGDPSAADPDARESGAVYLLAKDQDEEWIVETRIEPDVPSRNLLFGTALDIDGDQLLVGAPGANGVYIFERQSDGVWLQIDLLAPAHLPPAAVFGASMSVDGATLAIGAPGDNGPDGAEETGSVHTYVWVDDRWSASSVVHPDTLGTSDGFGQAVSLFGDTLAVGAPGEDSVSVGVHLDATDDLAPDAGAAYLFDRQPDGSWQQRNLIKGSANQAGAWFGRAVSLSNGQLIVGAPRHSEADAPYAGTVYLYTQPGDAAWRETARVSSPTPRRNGAFGSAVAQVGDVVAIGEPNATAADATTALLGVGILHVARLPSAGGIPLLQSVAPGDPVVRSFFGFRAALTDDALIVAAPGTEREQGAVYVMRAMP